MRICLVPLRTESRNPAENLRRFCNVLDQVRPQRPDLICLPECSFTGYLYDEADFDRLAEPIPGPTTAEISRLARAEGVYICFGLLESTPQGVYNTAILLDRFGVIAGVHRKLGEKPPFLNGSTVDSHVTEFGRLGMLICGDLFTEDVVAQLPSGLRLLLVPMARSFDVQSPDYSRWEMEERQTYLDAVRQVRVPAVIVNALETGSADVPFGGSLAVNAAGELLAESPHGTDEVMIYDFE